MKKSPNRGATNSPLVLFVTSVMLPGTLPTGALRRTTAMPMPSTRARASLRLCSFRSFPPPETAQEIDVEDGHDGIDARVQARHGGGEHGRDDQAGQPVRQIVGDEVGKQKIGVRQQVLAVGDGVGMGLEETQDREAQPREQHGDGDAGSDVDVQGAPGGLGVPRRQVTLNGHLIRSVGEDGPHRPGEDRPDHRHSDGSGSSQKPGLGPNGAPRKSGSNPRDRCPW